MATGLLEEENKTKRRTIFTRQPSLQKHVFFCHNVLHKYSTHEKYINFFFFSFSLCKGKNKTILSHGFWETSGFIHCLPPYLSTVSFHQSLFYRKDVSPSHQMSSETSLAEWSVCVRQTNANLINLFSQHVFSPFNVHSQAKYSWCKVFGDAWMVFTTAEPLCVCLLKYLHREK